MNGIIIVNKPAGYTSRDVVNIVGKKFKTKKVGHTGTLDPLATGVLVVCIENATKVSELLTTTDKEYIAEFVLGTLTDTLDMTGNVIKEEKVDISKIEIENILKQMIGSYEQEVPIYSAVKINGKKLYEYARNNEQIELPKHLVNIKKLDLLNVMYKNDKTIITIKCLVSKGTYIRALGNDIAHKLKTVASMSQLQRTRQGVFGIEDSYTLEEIKNDHYQLLELKNILDYPKIKINNKEYNRIKNGMIIDNIYNEEIVLFIYNNSLISIYKKYDKDKTKLKPWKMF